MSSVSTATPQLHAHRATAPHGGASLSARLAQTIGEEASAGTISSTDATALTDALGSIDTSLSSGSGAASAGSSAGSSDGAGSTLDPSGIKAKIDGLIADQVGSGALTGDQAAELKNLFASHGRSTTASAPGGDAAGVGGPPPGPPPAPPPGAATSSGPSDGSASESASSAAASASPTSASSDLFAKFIAQLQAAQSSGAGYGASGSAGSGSASALVFDFRS